MVEVSTRCVLYKNENQYTNNTLARREIRTMVGFIVGSRVVGFTFGIFDGCFVGYNIGRRGSRIQREKNGS